MRERFVAKPLTPVRKVIAARMTHAKQSIPHFRLAAELEIDALLLLRKSLRGGDGAEASLNDLMIKACATALMEVPAVNVQWAETEIHEYQAADISVVAALDGGGLTTPIVRSANDKSVWQISREVKALAARAAKNALKLDEVVGGSFTISNLGMYGVERFDAIINPPQCAILAVGAAAPRVVVSRDLQTRIATLLPVTLSVDHRAIDGALGASFLKALRRILEKPDGLFAAEAALGDQATAAQ